MQCNEVYHIVFAYNFSIQLKLLDKIQWALRVLFYEKDCSSMQSSNFMGTVKLIIQY